VVFHHGVQHVVAFPLQRNVDAFVLFFPKSVYPDKDLTTNRIFSLSRLFNFNPYGLMYCFAVIKRFLASKMITSWIPSSMMHPAGSHKSEPIPPTEVQSSWSPGYV
jgi:hypothetical protein